MAMTLEQAQWHAQWRPASGHPSGWRVCWEFFPPLKAPEGGFHFQGATGPKGKLRLFRSMESAQKAANKLNALEPKA